ncbi:uncharacterized protein LOC6526069 [Drosophila yakuba]|uniref:Uncharacterized protein n=1 Tax=Drosophila yakuba TaxID=7245 RepID=B4PY22_DROYA|nr:uncharacterized protein LOC6526069 [Drosophila yakuba]EDX02994.2 uncharacterized protein Dyak_GE15357 [Drosophila yakuba]
MSNKSKASLLGFNATRSSFDYEFLMQEQPRGSTEEQDLPSNMMDQSTQTELSAFMMSDQYDISLHFGMLGLKQRVPTEEDLTAVPEHQPGQNPYGDPFAKEENPIPPTVATRKGRKRKGSPNPCSPIAGVHTF